MSVVALAKEPYKRVLYLWGSLANEPYYRVSWFTKPVCFLCAHQVELVGKRAL